MKSAAFILAAVLALLTVSGCGFVGSKVARLTTNFRVLPSDHRVLYEDGAEALAEEAARSLPQAITSVEAKQLGAFREPVRIYAFAGTKSFAEFANVPEIVKGASTKTEVYLSGQLAGKTGEVRGMLAHELSHVQLSQALGTVTFNRTLPRWFREGLAIYVADGGGATNASEAETVTAFLQGRHFSPETEGALLNLALPGSKGLEAKIFYRQSGMFTRYLARSYPLEFRAFLEGVQQGRSFEAEFTHCFRCDVGAMLQAFIETLPRT